MERCEEGSGERERVGEEELRKGKRGRTEGGKVVKEGKEWK